MTTFPKPPAFSDTGPQGPTGVTPPPDGREVYAVPVKFVLATRVFVLARNAVDAVEQAEKLDYEDLYQFDDEGWWVDAMERLVIDDSAMDYVGATATIRPDYPPSDHPDWHPIVRE